jgi:hypothetical protein
MFNGCFCLYSLTSVSQRADMPAALDVNWEAVRVLAIAVGVREAARQMGLQEDAVRQRSSRERWLQRTEQQLPPTVQPRVVTGVTKAGDAAIYALESLGSRSRLLVAKGLLKGSQAVAKLDGDTVLQRANEIKAHVGSLKEVHSWSGSEGSNTLISLNFSSQEREEQPAKVIDVSTTA